MNVIYFIDFSLTVTVASLKLKMQKILKENKQRKKIIENEKYLNKEEKAY